MTSDDVVRTGRIDSSVNKEDYRALLEYIEDHEDLRDLRKAKRVSEGEPALKGINSPTSNRLGTQRNAATSIRHWKFPNRRVYCRASRRR